MAGRTRLELAASGVTGRRYNQLNYRPAGGAAYLHAPRYRVNKLVHFELDERDVRDLAADLGFDAVDLFAYFVHYDARVFVE